MVHHFGLRRSEHANSVRTRRGLAARKPLQLMAASSTSPRFGSEEGGPSWGLILCTIQVGYWRPGKVGAPKGLHEADINLGVFRNTPVLPQLPA